MHNLDTPGRLAAEQVALTDLVILPDGLRAVTTCNDGSLRRWDLPSGDWFGRQVGEPLRGHSRGAPISLAITPDGSEIISGGQDFTARRWNLETGRQVGEPLKHATFVEAVAYSPDGEQIVTGSGQRIRVWDRASGRRIHTMVAARESVSLMAVTPGGDLILSTDQSVIRVWDRTTGEQVDKLRSADYVADLVVTPDGAEAISCSLDGVLERWDLYTRSRIGEPSTLPSGRILAASPTDSLLAVGASEEQDDVCKIRFWDWRKGCQVGEPVSAHTWGIGALAFTPDGSALVSAGWNGTVVIWGRDPNGPKWR